MEKTHFAEPVILETCTFSSTGQGWQVQSGDMSEEMLRMPAEIKYAEELDYLESIDSGIKPFNWRLSAKMIRIFVLGSQPSDKLKRKVPQKWFGDASLVERSIVTLASDRGLLLIGDPGTLHSHFFGNQQLTGEALARSLIGTLVRRTPEDISIMNKFWHEVVQKQSKEQKGDCSGPPSFC